MNDIELADQNAKEAAVKLKQKISLADPDTLDLLLLEARSHNGWKKDPVSDAQLERIYEMTSMGPTSMNQQPMRLIFVRSQQEKERLLPALLPGNAAKTMDAPVTAIIGYDLRFFENFAEIFPPNPNAGEMFENAPDRAKSDAVRNGTLQAAYFMIAARAIGLDVGPMSGFDNDAVDKTFFADTSVKSNFLCNLGYGDEMKLFRRLPRLNFNKAAKIL